MLTSSRPRREGLPYYRLDEVQEHNTEDSAWIILEDRVYDVTFFDHPGSHAALMQFAGENATEAFEKQCDESSTELLESYHIGWLEIDNPCGPS